MVGGPGSALVGYVVVGAFVYTVVITLCVGFFPFLLWLGGLVMER